MALVVVVVVVGVVVGEGGDASPRWLDLVCVGDALRPQVIGMIIKKSSQEQKKAKPVNMNLAGSTPCPNASISAHPQPQTQSTILFRNPDPNLPMVLLGKK